MKILQEDFFLRNKFILNDKPVDFSYTHYRYIAVSPPV
jgi:hypothetical protein